MHTLGVFVLPRPVQTDRSEEGRNQTDCMGMKREAEERAMFGIGNYRLWPWATINVYDRLSMQKNTFIKYVFHE